MPAKKKTVVPDPPLPRLPWHLEGLQKINVRRRLGQILACQVTYIPSREDATRVGLEPLTNGWNIGLDVEFKGLVTVLVDCRNGTRAGCPFAIVPVTEAGHFEVWIKPLPSLA